ncbi:uncharacterized protein N7482_005387 [Penicillium canariense]|uniref:Uncharacterized protein n=1 Tax=Penicillium canariense TaxID=189055 RepID=A0A9W9I3S9_9EURO|nr:uncharacterized protein N7482_005387 [Penicillium canariense]KAJ5166606.1 hypothetical protein N7482_005387 [Penicillium canariense]
MADKTLPSWAYVKLDRPRSGSTESTPLLIRIASLAGGREPQAVGPIIALLFSVENLHQVVSRDPSLFHITRLGHAGLIDFRARLTEGDPRVLRALHGSLVDHDRIRDAIALTEGLLLIDRSLQTMTDAELKPLVQQIRDELRAPPETPSADLYDPAINGSF